MSASAQHYAYQISVQMDRNGRDAADTKIHRKRKKERSDIGEQSEASAHTPLITSPLNQDLPES